MGLVSAVRAFFRELASTPSSVIKPPPVEAFKPSTAPAAQLLGLLQDKGRFVDFIMEDISAYSDAQVGAAVRSIHAGCREVLTQRVVLARVANAGEGASLAVAPDQVATGAVRLLGNASGAGPWNGRVRHAGWRIAENHLPTVPAGIDPDIVAPAEVEVGS